MRKIILSVLVISFPFIYVAGQQPDLNEALDVLDETLKNRDQYTRLKESRIDTIKNQINIKNSATENYLLNKKIINEYSTYLCDSAIVYAEKNLKIADKLEDKRYRTESILLLAKMYALAGLFYESFQILDPIAPESLPKDLRGEYYAAFYRFYDALFKYTNDEKYNDKYRKRMVVYLDSVQSLMATDTEAPNIESFYIDFLENRHELVIKKLSANIPRLDPDSHVYAIATSCLAYAYKARNEKPELQKEYLAKAAITDARLSVKDHSALLNLAILLYNENDIDRAYKYITIALEDANLFNSRYRNTAIAKIFPIIEKTYQQKIDNQKTNLTFSLILVSILGIGLLFTSLYIYKQVRIAVKARRSLKQLNEKLDEANHIKEEYIGYFLNQCSVYVNKLDEYKQLIYRKIKSGQIDDLIKSVSSATSRKKDIEELYTSFDAAFLKLYPGFVNDFNRLLKEDERYKVKSNELNTELRIFALIRLGITDNRQISSFLRYSIQTIYNYRSKVKAKSLNEGEDFEEKVKNIGVL